MSGTWCIAANVIGPDTTFRPGAKVEIEWTTGDVKVPVRGVSKGGRRVREKWMPLHRLDRFRPAFVHDGCDNGRYATKDDAAEECVVWQAKADSERAVRAARGTTPDDWRDGC